MVTKPAVLMKHTNFIFSLKMELTTISSTPTIIFNIPINRKLFSVSNSTHLCSKTSLSCIKSGLPHFTNLSFKSSEKRSNGATRCYGEEHDVVTTLEDVSLPKKSVYNDTLPMEVSKDEPSEATDEQTQVLELLEKLNNFKVDSLGTSSILLLGSGALVSLWLASAVVGAIDAIPVFPKLMEVVGLSYTLWFTTRYLLFKENRDELAAKIEQIKEQVLGSIED